MDMIQRLTLCFAVAATILLACLPASAQASDVAAVRDAIASRNFLLGTWHCTFTVGTEGGEYATTWSSILEGMGLKQTYDQPKQPRAGQFKAEYLIGYDAVLQKWMRFGLMTTGQYFTIRMTDTGNGGWGWRYAGFFSGKQTGATGYDARFTRKNDSLYTVDGPTYPRATGQMVTEHHVCRKE
jgi:hypothetical protein